MSAQLPSSLLSFARDVLETSGALVESHDGTLEALVPPELRAPLGASEELLVIEAADGSGAERSLEPGSHAPLLAGLARLAQGEGRLAALALPTVQRWPQDLQREPSEVFSSPGASTRAERLVPGHAGYLRFELIHEVRGAQRLRGTTPVLLAEETGLEPPGLLQASTAWDLPWEEPSRVPPPPDDLPRLYEAAGRIALRKLQRKLVEHTEQTSAYLTEIDHQVSRYSTDLAEEVSTSIARRKLSDEEIERRQQRLEESQAALARLRERLRSSCTLDIRLALLGAVRLKLPVLRCMYTVQRNKATRTVPLIWSGLTQGWEPLACESCGAATFAFSLCPGPAHLLCLDCHEQVQQHGRMACGSCHARGGGDTVR